MSTLTYELGNKLIENPTYKLVLVTMKNTIVRFLAKVVVFLILNSSFLQKLILQGIIQNFKEIVEILIGYGNTLENLTIPILRSDYQSIQKVLPVYQYVNNFLNHLEPKDELSRELLEVSNQIIQELESLEATLEIYSEASDVADLREAENDLKINKSMFSKWIINS